MIIRLFLESGELRPCCGGVRLQLDFCQKETGFVFVKTVSELARGDEHRIQLFLGFRDLSSLRFDLGISQNGFEMWELAGGLLGEGDSLFGLDLCFGEVSLSEEDTG